MQTRNQSLDRRDDSPDATRQQVGDKGVEFRSWDPRIPGNLCPLAALRLRFQCHGERMVPSVVQELEGKTGQKLWRFRSHQNDSEAPVEASVNLRGRRDPWETIAEASVGRDGSVGENLAGGLGYGGVL